jgi:hypothetical protein
MKQKKRPGSRKMVNKSSIDQRSLELYNLQFLSSCELFTKEEITWQKKFPRQRAPALVTKGHGMSIFARSAILLWWQRKLSRPERLQAECIGFVLKTIIASKYRRTRQFFYFDFRGFFILRSREGFSLILFSCCLCFLSLSIQGKSTACLKTDRRW